MYLPKKIDVIEVGPRDGFQNVKEFIQTDAKINIIEKIIASGMKSIELTSFVQPKAIPQMADAKEVAKTIIDKYKNDDSLEFMSLVPNAKGAENALNTGIKKVCYVISVSESHNKNNVNSTVQKSLDDLRDLVTSYPELEIRLDVATAFGCPFEGEVAVRDVLALVDTALEIGVDEIVLCDTIGVAYPSQVENLLGSVKKHFPKIGVPALHLHDTRGMGIANVLVGMNNDVTRIETSIGGLGGCPFAPGAAGNTATEDLLNMLDSMGIETGVDFEKYMDALSYVSKHVKSDLTGHMLKAIKGKESLE